MPYYFHLENPVYFWKIFLKACKYILQTILMFVQKADLYKKKLENFELKKMLKKFKTIYKNG